MKKLALAVLVLVLIAPGLAWGQASGTTNARGFVTTAAPSYTNSTYNLLSLDTAGNLRTTSAGTADATTGSTALGAINAVITIALAGERGVAFQLQSGGTGVYTVTPQCSFDGGTIYNSNGYIQDPVTGVVSLTAVIASAQATTDYPVMCPQGSSHAQMKVTAYTSGTANWLARATTISWPGLAWGIVTTAAPSYTTGLINGFSLTTAGALREDLNSLAGVTVSVGNGVTNTGTQRVTISSDSTGQVTLATGANVIGSLSANQSVNVAQVAGTNTVTGGVAGTLGVGGLAASGGAKAGNPNQIGYVFNTTQPTVTTGQAVEAQGTARGAAIVATGVDAFAVNASQTGTWTVQPGNTANTTAWLVTQGGNGAILSGQQSVTASAVALATNTIKRINVKALAGNTSPTYIGPSGETTGTGYELQPGDSTGWMNLNNSNLVFIIGTASNSISWVAEN